MVLLAYETRACLKWYFDFLPHDYRISVRENSIYSFEQACGWRAGTSLVWAIGLRENSDFRLADEF